MDANRRAVVTAALALASGASLASETRAWPAMPLTLTVPFSPGGGTDMLARTLAEKLSAHLGSSVIVENKPGAAGNIGAEMVVRDKTLHRLLFTTASIAVNPSLYKGLRYDVERDLAPISMLTSSPLVLAVPGSSEVRSLDDLRRLGDSRPDGLNYGSPGPGTTSHLGCAVLSRTMELKATHIPYKGAGPVTTALIGREIDFSMLAAVAAAGHIRNGTLRAIGVAGKQAPPGLEGVPLLADQNPQLEFDNWQALFAPAGLEAKHIEWLQQALHAVLQQPDVVEKIRNEGATPLGLAPEPTARQVRAELERYARIVRDFDIQVG